MMRTCPAALIVVASVFLMVASAAPSQALFETPFFVCGQDDRLDAEIAPRWETVVLAADGRLYAPCWTPTPHPREHRERREMQLLVRAATARNDRFLNAPEFRRLAAQAFGRIGADLVRIEPLLSDGAAAVRREAVVAIGAALHPAVREPADWRKVRTERAGASGASAAGLARVARGRALLEQRLGLEEDARVVGAILETLGRLPYDDDASLTQVESLLAGNIPLAGSPHRLLGAVKGLEVLIRKNRRHEAAADTVERLRGVVMHSTASAPLNVDARPGETVGDLDIYAQARRAAMLTLTGAGDSDVPTVLAATRDVDWQVRRLAVLRMNAELPEFTSAVRAALGDPAFQVRLDAVRVMGRSALRSGDCAALVDAVDDNAPAVVMAALDALTETCGGSEIWLPGIVDAALELERNSYSSPWHVPTRAALAVARVAPAEAGRLLAAALEHPLWQVRAAGAEMAELLHDEPAAVRLAADPEPNVRTAALGALQRMQSPALHSAALEGLQSDDFDVIRTSARFLEGAPDRDEAASMLRFKLGALTDDAWDTSRDPRVAIIERLAELLDPSQASSLLSYVDDFDPRISLAASQAVMKLTDSDDWPVPRQRQRYPYQPSVETLASVPRSATIRLEGGAAIELAFLLDQAPVSTARFAELARSGYYNGLTFHRFAPNFVVQGGSPGANEYSGTSRYLRDEIGASNLRGTIGLSTRGRDTGDGQIFINLVDNLRLDGDYTVFARVVAGMDVVDQMLPGARIETITLR